MTNASSSASTARENARRGDGKFGVQAKKEASVSLRTEPNYDGIRAKYRTLVDMAYPANDPDGELDVEAFRSAFKPSAIVGQAHRIYDYMREHNIGPDSATREAAFAYAAADTGLDYNVLYDAWLDQKPIEAPCTSCGTVIKTCLADSTGRCSTCVGEWVRKATGSRRRR